jgi:hypothetical protein
LSRCHLLWFRLNIEYAPTHSSGIGTIRPTFTNTHLHPNPHKQVGNVCGSELVRIPPNAQSDFPLVVSGPNGNVWLTRFDARHIFLLNWVAVYPDQGDLGFVFIVAIRYNEQRQLGKCHFEPNQPAG